MYLDEFIETGTSYVSIVRTKSLCIYNNNKPWFVAKLKQPCNAKKEAYRKEGRTLYDQARNINKGNKEAKRSHSEKLRNLFSANESATVW